MHTATTNGAPGRVGIRLLLAALAMQCLVTMSLVTAATCPATAADPAAADGPRLLAAGVPYATTTAAEDAGRTLDIYGSAAGVPRPIVVYVHGGGWRHGDKALVGAKPTAFVDRGYLFASVGYRLCEPVAPREQAGDVAQAVAWLHEHAARFGGDPDAIVLVGHSAGAHLAALVATDERLLGASGLGLDAVAGVVLLDGAGYDVPRQVASARLPALARLFLAAFGDDHEAQWQASPIANVAAGKRMPAFLLFHVGMRQDSRDQSEALARAIRTAGGRATTVHEPGKNHLTINREIGLPGDAPTARLFAFLDDVLADAATAPASP